MALTLVGKTPTAAQITAAFAPTKAPTGTTITNSSGQKINDQGNVVGGAVTGGGGLSYNGVTAIPGSTGETIAPITQSSLTPVQTVQVPPTPVTADYGSLLNGTLATTGLFNYDGSIKPQTTNTTKTQPNGLTDLATLTSNLLSQNQPVKTEDIYNKDYAAAGIEAKQNLVNQYTNQLNGIVTKQQADLLKVRGDLAANGGTEAVYGGIQATINREAAINALPVSAQLAAAQGDLATAQSHLDTLFKIQSADAQAQYDYKNKLIESVIGFATEAEKRQFETLKTMVANDREDKKTFAASQLALASKATDYGQSNLISQIYAATDPVALSAVQAKMVNPDTKSANGVTSSFTDIMQQAIDAGATAEQAAREAAISSENSGIQVDQKTLNSWTAIAKTLKKVPVVTATENTTATSTPKIEEDINSLKTSYTPDAIKYQGLDSLLVNDLLRKGYTNRQIQNSSLGSPVDKAINSIADFLFK